MGAPVHDLLRAQAAGHLHLRDEEYEAACASFAEALRALALLDPSPGNELLKLELLVALAEAQIECKPLEEAQRDVKEARAAIDALAAHGIQVPAVVDAGMSLNEARLIFLQRDYDAMAQRARNALAALGGEAQALGSGPALLAKCHAALATALSLIGRPDDALPEYRKAWALLDTPAARHLGKDRALVMGNLANAENTVGHHEDSRAHYAQALTLLAGLVDAGSRCRLIDVARTHMNLGALLNTCNQFDAAIASYRTAIDIYATEIRRRRRRGANASRLCSSHANTWMNLGYTLFRAKRYEQAGAAFKRALHGFKNVTAITQQLQDAEARAWVNHAHLLHAQQRLSAARQRYAAGATVFKKLIADGREYLRADLANADLGLARVLAAQGRAEAAAAHAEPALRSLAELTRQGQLQHGRAWLQGLRRVCDSIVSASAQARRDAPPNRRPAVELRYGRALRALTDCMHDAPIWGHPIGPEPIADVLDASEQLAHWCSKDSSPELTRLTHEFVSYLLGRTAALLGDADPAWLQQHAAKLSDAVEKLRHLALAHPDGAALLADWFLSTRGLRAQRDALALSSDAGVRAFAELLARLRQIEEELLGQWQGPSDELSDGVRAASAPSPTAADGDRAAEWMRLHRRCEAESQRLTQQGLLPPRLRLQARDVVDRLADGQALFLLARPVPDRVLFIALRRPDVAGPFALAIEVPLGRDSKPFRCGDLIGLVRRSLVAAGGGRGFRRAPDTTRFDPGAAPAAPGEAEFAAAMLRAIADAVAVPMVERLREWRLRDAVLIPSDDLHLLPWRHELARHWPAGCGLHTYPSVGTWARHHARARVSAEALRWACAVCPSQGARSALPWVQVEYALSARLWQGSAPPPVLIDSGTRTAQGVSAFIGMGHGGARDGNLAAAGVDLGDGEVLTAHDLPAIQSSRRVLLSCCVLGQTREVLGEPLGFLSACFSYETEFGTGWLTEVPDAMACLFSLAFQFTLRDAMSAGSAIDDVAWSDVFERTRQGILAGRWPAGFGAWLRANLPQVVEALRQSGAAPLPNHPLPNHASGLFAAPPQELQRLMPWVICVGR